MEIDQYRDELNKSLSSMPQDKRLEFLVEERELLDDEAPNEICLQMLAVVDSAIAEILKTS